MGSPSTFDSHSVLLTDFYQLTMLACYFYENKHKQQVTFEYFLRPQTNRPFFVFAGGEQVLDYLEHLRFSKKDIQYLKSLEAFKKVPEAFFDFLQKFRFRGEVRMVPEGTLVFPNEPLLQVSGTLAEAQLIETYLLSMCNFQTMIATKASRILRSAQGRPVFEFGTRRAHGPQAGVFAARASCLVGCAGTSNVLAGAMFNLPVVGTAAHSFILSHSTETSAFQAYYDLFQEQTTLLIDTYDTLQGAKNATQVGPLLKGVRLDSGDLVALSKAVRQILDAEGHSQTKIVASNDLNETRITELLKQGAPIDAFGVGTELVTSRDQPALPGVYKLVEIEENKQRQPKMKWAPEKISYPAKKQVFRQIKDGKAVQDLLALENESHEGIPLLQTVMQKGKRILKSPSLLEIQDYYQKQNLLFTEEFLQKIQEVPQHANNAYPVRPSAQLSQLVEQLKPTSIF